MNFADKITTQKGTVGEQLVIQYLQSNGFSIHSAVDPEKAHIGDLLASPPDKSELFMVEIKTKPKRIKYDDTGLNQKSFEEYNHISKRHNMKVLIVFVDEENALIYGNWLDVLETPIQCNTTGSYSFDKQYPLVDSNNDIHFWPLSRMKPFCNIDDRSKNEITSLSTKDVSYARKQDRSRTLAILGSQLN